MCRCGIIALNASVFWYTIDYIHRRIAKNIVFYKTLPHVVVELYPNHTFAMAQYLKQGDFTHVLKYTPPGAPYVRVPAAQA